MNDVSNLTLLVLANPRADWLKVLDRLDSSIERIVTHEESKAIAEAPRADVFLNGSVKPDLLRAAVVHGTKARWMHSLWTGVDRILSPEVIASPIPLTNGRGVFRRSLAEWSIGAMLHFAYKMRRMIRQQESGIWEIFTTEELHGRTLGIIGYGEIGQAAAERARAFGMKILALRRRPELSRKDILIDRAYAPAEINNLIAASDYVLVAAPLTPETRGMVGAAQIAAMKPTAVILNVGRGAVIDEAPLIEALRENRIKGAALDVFAQEPLPPGHPFYSMPNLLLSPHTADHFENFADAAAECFLENLSRFRTGEPLLNVVDKQAGY
jgi:phosphoglycerate dehydrogenase-like enzyme